MNQWFAAKLARQLMDEHDLSDWTFRFNHQKRTLGLCRYHDQRIELSLHFVVANGEPAVRDTILHEIAHALAGPAAGHGARWKQVCRRIGAVPQRLDHAAHMPRGKWRAACPGCGYEYTRHRRPPRGAHYLCRACGPKRGKLVFQLHRSSPQPKP